TPTEPEEDHKELGAQKPVEKPIEELEEDFGVLGAEKPAEKSKDKTKTPATSISNDVIFYGTTFITSLSGFYLINKRRKK
ncbi:MAG: hypothetical protein GX769_02280, partial [Erysipelothrix sp.]|nr:hypothetical protein [Erysipelothrix sp.]